MWWNYRGREQCISTVNPHIVSIARGLVYQSAFRFESYFNIWNYECWVYFMFKQITIRWNDLSTRQTNICDIWQREKQQVFKGIRVSQSHYCYYLYHPNYYCSFLSLLFLLFTRRSLKTWEDVKPCKSVFYRYAETHKWIWITV